MTNYESIKNMTEEQLADMIAGIAFKVLSGLAENKELMDYVAAGMIDVLGQEIPDGN